MYIYNFIFGYRKKTRNKKNTTNNDNVLKFTLVKEDLVLVFDC